MELEKGVELPKAWGKVGVSQVVTGGLEINSLLIGSDSCFAHEYSREV